MLTLSFMYIYYNYSTEEVLTKEHNRKDNHRMSESSESQPHVICNDLVVNPIAVITKPAGNGYRLNVPEK